ncbi:hypothetical protein [Actinobaculum sp. 352]|uniref:WXG100 family type VII secretion target n=1 Tax=Actinobaculum sp. 352 TaxID=2490946 RepID=UPI000F7E5080|nr:hypothetical protein [Actinobaculum sp. 352]RTE50615.1 hypothetical protein EKN07_00175 [Actinobaculum sp. 352]
MLDIDISPDMWTGPSDELKESSSLVSRLGSTIGPAMAGEPFGRRLSPLITQSYQELVSSFRSGNTTLAEILTQTAEALSSSASDFLANEQRISTAFSELRTMLGGIQ